MRRIPPRVAVAAVAVSILVGSAGCSLHAMTGDMLAEYSTLHVGPYLMESDDLGMACETGVSLGGQLLSYARVTDSPDQPAVSTLVSAASCAEEHAWSAQLRSLRALRAGDSAGARDARIVEKRAHTVAASRYYRAYLRLAAGYGEPGGACPVLEDKLDELAWLLGMIAGANAVQHDRAAGGEIDVPTDVPIKVTRGLECLDDARWFSIPTALQAAIWLGVPGSTPEGVDPWERLAAAAAAGAAKGVRIAQALQGKSAEATGDAALLRQVITSHAASREQVPSHSEFRLLDANATRLILHMSDVLWTQAMGHRTPHQGLGSFWESPDDEGDDDLLEGLDDPDPSSAPEASP